MMPIFFRRTKCFVTSAPIWIGKQFKLRFILNAHLFRLASWPSPTCRGQVVANRLFQSVASRAKASSDPTASSKAKKSKKGGGSGGGGSGSYDPTAARLHRHLLASLISLCGGGGGGGGGESSGGSGSREAGTGAAILSSKQVAELEALRRAAEVRSPKTIHPFDKKRGGGMGGMLS